MSSLVLDSPFRILSRCQKVHKFKICFWHVIVAVLTFIIIYGLLVRKVFKKDVLMEQPLPCDGCDWWGITHGMMYFVLGYLFPDHLFILMVIGIIWELIEHKLGTLKLPMFGIEKGMGDVLGKVDQEEKTEWWFGRTTDIALNLVGLISGYSLHQITNKSEK